MKILVTGAAGFTPSGIGKSFNVKGSNLLGFKNSSFERGIQ